MKRLRNYAITVEINIKGVEKDFDFVKWLYVGRINKYSENML